jgi:hypothetical protein
MWVLLVVLAVLVLGLLGWRLYQQVRALLREVSAASRRAADTQAQARSAFEAWRAERTEADAVYLAGLEQDVR